MVSAKSLWQKLPRWSRIGLAIVACLGLLIAATGGTLWWYFHPHHTRTDRVI
jgi:hypothetical protein